MQIADSTTSINLLRSVLWQYDHAPNLLALIKGLAYFSNVSTDEFWQRFLTEVLNVDTANGSVTPPSGGDTPFTGLDTLGRVIGVQRPVAASTGEAASDSFYRRLLKAHLFLSKADASARSIGQYLVILFGAERQIDIASINPKIGDSITIGAITYTFISESSEYGEATEIKLGANDSETARNIAAAINGEGTSAPQDPWRNPLWKQNPNVSGKEVGDSGATASGATLTLDREYWPAEGETAVANVVVIDNADMTIGYRVPDPLKLSDEETDLISPIDQSTQIVSSGRCLGYTLSGDRIYGYVDQTTGQTVENPAFPIIFPFPAGVRSNLGVVQETLSPLGLNETEEQGQNLANFVFDESQPNGAPYSAPPDTEGGDETP